MSAPKREKFARLSGRQILSCSLYHPETSAKKVSSRSKPQNLREGLLFDSKNKYSVGDLLRLQLSIPLLNSKDDTLSVPVTLIGNVVRVAMVAEGLYQIGICFTKLDQQYRSRLLECLAEKHACDADNASRRENHKERGYENKH